nr:J191 [uncultured bacterium]
MPAAGPVDQVELGHVRLAAHQFFAVVPARIVGRPVAVQIDLGAGNAGQGVLHHLPGHLDVLGQAVQGAVDVPHAKVQLLGDLAPALVGDDARLVPQLLAQALHRGAVGDVLDDHAVLDDHVHLERSQDFHQLRDVFLFLVSDHERLVGRRLGHQPEAHLGDDAEVALREHAVHVRPEAVLEQLPAGVAGHGAHAGAQQLAVGEQHFHAAREQKMVGVGRVTGAVFERIADNAAPAGRRAVDPQLVALLLQVLVELEVGHARLDQAVARILIHFQDAVHALQIQHQVAGLLGRRAAIGEVLAVAVGPQRQLVLVGDLQHGLHFGHRGGRDGHRRHARFRHHGGHVVQIGLQIPLRVREDPGRAHDLADFRQGGLEILARYAVRQVLGHRFLLAVAGRPRLFVLS